MKNSWWQYIPPLSFSLVKDTDKNPLKVAAIVLCSSLPVYYLLGCLVYQSPNPKEWIRHLNQSKTEIGSLMKSSKLEDSLRK